jgi:hypothetical protein
MPLSPSPSVTDDLRAARAKYFTSASPKKEEDLCTPLAVVDPVLSGVVKEEDGEEEEEQNN